MKVVVAPDSFKGTLSADDVSSALALGVTAAGAVPVVCPLADGGEGTVDVLHRALGGTFRRLEVRGPLGDPVEGRFLLAGETAVIDTATASGLTLVPDRDRDAERASTHGTGELVAAARAAGARRILLGVGGSATTDGGAGAIEAITAAGGLPGVSLTVLCDVRTAFEDAPARFGPQKGADPATVGRLEQRLHDLAARLPRDPRGVPMTGAAGGLSGGLWAAFDADLVPGIDAVLDAIGFDALVDGATAVFTGEGRLDAQTAEGKVVAGVGRRAKARSVRVFAFVGQQAVPDEALPGLGLSGAVEAGTPAALTAAAEALTADLHSS